MTRSAILFSITPKNAENILRGGKRIELRRRRPNISKGDLMLIYVTSPQKALRAISVVEALSYATPDELWVTVKEKAGITFSEFSEYFAGARMGYAIAFRSVQELVTPIELTTLRGLWPGFHPPRSHRYFSSKELAKLDLPMFAMSAFRSSHPDLAWLLSEEESREFCYNSAQYKS